MSTRQLFIPLFLLTELERLANACGVDFNISDDSGESEYLYFMDKLVTNVEGSQQQIETLQMKLNKRDASPDRNKYSTKLSAKEQKLMKQSQAFGQEISQDIEKAEEGLGYAEKMNRLHQKFQKEKDERKVLETFVQAQNKKIRVLVDHVEKLMKAIKIESNKRIHLAEEIRRKSTEQNAIELRAEKQERINTLQHRTIQELREGSKVLEDQLRLMDEKYLELKSKYDMSREQFNCKYKKMSKDNDDLRIFIRMNGGMRATNSSSPQSPIGNMQITIPALINNQNIAVGSAMNHAMSKKSSAGSATFPPPTAESTFKSKVPESAASTAMSASFLAGLMSPKANATIVMDTVNSVQTFQKSGPFDEGGETLYRPISAQSPVTRHQMGMMHESHGRRPQSSSFASKKNKKALNHVMDKITRHSGKKSVWSADRLSSLLED